MTLSTIPLISGGYLVKGTDTEGVKGSTILTSDSWDRVVHVRQHRQADETFDAAVEEFFAPIVAAAEQASAALAGPTQDWGTVVFDEGVQGEEAQAIQLDGDGILLRILHEGNQNLLRWVGDDKLVAIQV
jgi:hypothetical protein